MKGFATPSSPFARKVRMVAIETEQRDLIEWRMLTREERPKVVPPFNPLGKVPVVVLDSGEALYDSPVICAYVDSLHTGRKMIPEEAAGRWRALRLEALGDGLTEAVVGVALEQAKPAGERAQSVLDRHSGKVASVLAALDAEAATFRDTLTIGEIAVACGLGYMEYRSVSTGWRETYAALAAWYNGLADRPSFAETLPE